MFAEIRPRGALSGWDDDTYLTAAAHVRRRAKKRRRISAAPRVETHSVLDSVATQAVPPTVDAALDRAKDLAREAGSKAASFVAKTKSAARTASAQANRAESASRGRPTPAARKTVGKAILKSANAQRRAIKASATAQKYKVAKGFAKMAAADLGKSRKLAAQAKSAQRRNPARATQLAKAAIVRRDRGAMNLKRAQAAHSAQLAVPVPRGISKERLASVGKKFGLRVRFAGKRPGQGAPAPVSQVNVKGALGDLGALHGNQLEAVANLYGLDGLGVALAAAELGEFGALGAFHKSLKKAGKALLKGAAGGAAAGGVGVATKAIQNKLGVSDETIRAAVGVAEGKVSPSATPVQLTVAPQVSVSQDEEGLPWGWIAGGVAGAAVLGAGAWFLSRRRAA